jgi:hypothetical protein
MNCVFPISISSLLTLCVAIVLPVSGSSTPSVTSVALVDGRTRKEVEDGGTLKSRHTINLSKVTPGSIDIRASASADTKSVRFRLNNRTYLARRAPFLAFRGSRSSSWRPKNGSYRLRVTPFPLTNGKGKAGKSYQINLRIIGSPTRGTSHSRFPPIPSLSRWESQMKHFGEIYCNQGKIAELGTWEGNVWYYDGIRVYYQIAEYTHDSKWRECARYVRAVYRDYVLGSQGRIPGWRVFPHGLQWDFEMTGDNKSKEAVMKLATDSAFAPRGGGAPQEESRETAYIIEAYLAAEKLGAGRHPKLSTAVNNALSHIDQWTSSSSYVQSFMVGLTMEALIQYHERTGDDRVPHAVKKAADWLWQNSWNERQGYFQYVFCRNGSRSGPCGERSEEGSDLNLLIAPAFAWLYRRTGDDAYLTQGDAIFSKGVTGAYLGNGKHFSQNYRWSFDFVRWRKN